MSQLQLNGPNEPVAHYKEFHGRSTEQMAMLIADGRVPMSVNGVMQRNLKVLEKDASGMYKFSDPVRSAWMDNYFDTGDAIALHPNGNIKVVLDAQPLREMNSRSQLSDCALVLPDGMYEKLEGHEFTREQIKNYIDKWLARDEAKSNPLWLALARDSNILNSYVDSIFAQASQRFKYDKNMGLYVPDTPKEPQMRSWCIGGLSNRSLANGRLDLDNEAGRLVGVGSEARVAQKSATLEHRV